MLKNTVRTKFYRDIRFLEKNEQPMESYGERVDELIYKIGSVQDEEQLNDDDVRELSRALIKNEVFQGPLDLSNNNLTDLVSYY